MRPALTICFVALLGLGVLSYTQAGGRSDAKVKLTAVPGKVDSSGKQTITLKLEIEKGWHLYANPVANENFEPNQTIVKVYGGVQEAATKVVYPKGHEYVVNKEKILIYEGATQIGVTVQRLNNDPIDVHVKVFACDDKACLPPGNLKVKVP